MKIGIFGAGAVGGYLAAALHRANCTVTLIDRGDHLRALQERGLTLLHDDGEENHRLPACAPADAPGSFDYLCIAVKTWSIPGALEDIAPLVDAETVIVSAHNGIPWWYLYGLDPGFESHHLESVDPGARQWQVLGPARAVGCVFYPACEIEAPGIVRHVSGNRVALGEPSGEKSPRVERLARVLRDGGLKAPVRPDIRNEVWMKLIGNLAFNPLSVLTGGTLAELCADPDTRATAVAIMREGQAVAGALGARLPLDIDRRIDGAAAVGAHKTSMLQDYESGLPLELDAIVRSVRELGRLTGCATPAIEGVLRAVAEKLDGNTAPPERLSVGP